jgi:hypothetical protein
MRSILAASLCATLCGCASSDANIYGSPMGQRVVGNEAYVTISNVWNEMDGLPLAEKHCGQFDKAARFKGMEGGYRAIYDCVQR